MSMRPLSARLVFASILGSLALAGCGGDGTPPPDPDAGPDAASCLALEDSCSDGAECCSGVCEGFVCVAEASCGKALSASCGTDDECCSGNCDSGICVGPVGECTGLSLACDHGWECCSGNCGGGSCVAPTSTCYANTDACVANVECCSGNCDGTNHCAFSFVSVGLNGSACDEDSDCGSGDCAGNVCVPTTCDDAGTACTPADAYLCCSGNCSEVDGTCGEVPACQEEGTVCGAHWECCSGLCNPYEGTCEPAVPPPV